MTEPYKPTPAQFLFGQPGQELECPQILDAALGAISRELSRVLWNLHQREIEPFGNTGGSFKCDTFCVCAYSWSDAPQPWNFKHYSSGVEVSWYKYYGRGMSVNRAVTPDESAIILRDCLAALLIVESGEMQYSEPGLYPEGALKIEE